MKGYLATPVQRACSTCGADFTADRPQSLYCSKECAAAARKVYQKRFKERHPDRVKESARVAYLRNREAVIARTTEYRRTMKGRAVAAESQRRARAKDPAKFRARDAVRRGKAGKGRQSAELANAIREILAQQKYRCAYCRVKLPNTPGGWDVDHIVPLASGGTNDRANLQCLCQRCNASKRDMDPILFSQKMGMLL